jgi:two-component system sensor histidine kinase EvgS
MLNTHGYDLIISDFRLPKFSGEHALEIYKTSGLDIPFILVSGTIGEEVAVSMMKSGAHDYIMKDHIVRIGPAVTRELREADIRRQRRMTLEELRLAKEKAEQSDHLKTTLLSNMSHEFRTPLTGILGFAQVIQNATNDPDIRQSAIRIHKSGMRLMKTLDSIVWLSQLESGIKPTYREFDLYQMISQVVMKHREFLTYKKLDCTISSDEDHIPVTSDEELIARAFASVLDNAIKYTREGGVTITPSVETANDRKIIRITVTDTGIGINPNDLTVIFDAFKQVSEGFSRHYEGIGLGLTIARKIMHLIGGNIHVESIPEKGSSFSLEFPVQSPAVKQEAKSAHHRDGETRKTPVTERLQQRILVVEDNETNAELVRLFLRHKYQITVASDGPRALALCESVPFDLIMMDINLGQVMSGIEAVKLIRHLPGYQSIPILAITGYTQYGDRSRLLAHGCTHYLAKPFTKEQLLKMVESI